MERKQFFFEKKNQKTFAHREKYATSRGADLSLRDTPAPAICCRQVLKLSRE
jgi:hypothetical protein